MKGEGTVYQKQMNKMTVDMDLIWLLESQKWSNAWPLAPIKQIFAHITLATAHACYSTTNGAKVPVSLCVSGC